MSDPIQSPDALIPDVEYIHRVAEEFDADWQVEQWTRMANLVAEAPASIQPALAAELIEIDLQRRIRLEMTVPGEESYLHHIPAFAQADEQLRKRIQLGEAVHDWMTANEGESSEVPVVEKPRRSVSGQVVFAMACLAATAAGIFGGLHLQERYFRPKNTAVEPTNLTVRISRPGVAYAALSESLPVRNDDLIQVKFQAPAGMHVGLWSVDGEGRLSLIQQYERADSSYQAYWPAYERSKTLLPPVGTEFLFVCGSADRPATLEELQTAWDADHYWPALEPPTRLLRLRQAQITDEGPKDRRFIIAETERPEEDPIRRRLERFRERLRAFPVLDGVAFRHE